MKKRISLFILMVVACRIPAQELIVPQDTLPVYTKYYQLNESQSSAWKKVDADWNKEFLRILKEQDIKLSCKDCSAVYIDVGLSITNEGKMEYYRLVDSKKCGENFSKGLEIRFMKWFFNYNFPKELRNLKVEVHLGDALKC
ncbi:MAG: hypothetical protein K0Q95_1495 [Bacteroidota bacterium]|jgi:hypothetical protein|nr:hypothetical protein [Bacteroidota bacterium]